MPIEHIVTSFIDPPIPERRWDWCAQLACVDEYGPAGFGETEAAAVADLREQLTERETAAAVMLSDPG